MTYLPVRFAWPGREAGVTDGFGLAHAVENVAGLAAFARATVGLAGYRRDTGLALAAALELAPAMTAAYALRGMAEVLRVQPEAAAPARAAMAAAIDTLGPHSTADEIALCEALRTALDGRLLGAAEVLDARLAAAPGALLLLKLSTMLRFIGGDAAGMVRTTGVALPAWRPTDAGYGFVLGCRSFALEEVSDYAGAERAGRAALAHTPHNPWAIHAVAHVFEMRTRPREGIAWLEGCRGGWAGANNFAFHVAWHLALFHLELGEHDRVLELYDREVRPAPSEDNRDMANATALLWRLRQFGVDVGGRWSELAEIARRRRGETALVFAALHRIFALLAVGDFSAVDDVLEALAAGGRGEQAAVARAVGLPLARAMAGHGIGGLAGLECLGGSMAQRDVFVRTLTMLPGGEALLRARGRADRFSGMQPGT